MNITVPNVSARRGRPPAVLSKHSLPEPNPPPNRGPAPPPPPPSTPPPSIPPPPASPAQITEFHIGEEFGTAQRNLPPVRILLLCLGAVAVIVGIFAFQ